MTAQTIAERIPLEDVVSSNIQGLGYNLEKRILAVKFKSGAIFHFADVTPAFALEFFGAESKGSFFAQRIKGGKVHGSKMTGTCPNCGDEHGWIGETCSECGTAVYAESKKHAE